MTGPAAGIFAALIICLAGLIIWQAARGRFLPKSAAARKLRRIGLIMMAISALCMALSILFTSTLAFLGQPESTLEIVTSLALLLGMVSAVLALLLFMIEPATLAAYTHMPTWLYHWLYGESDHQLPSAGS